MTRVLAFCLLLLSVPLTAASTEREAIDLLEEMAQAAREVNYQGVFAYHNGRALQSIRIYHRHDEGGEVERLISLNGAAREVIRTDDMVTCINPEGKQISVSRRPLGRGFPSDLPRRLHSAVDFYELSLGETQRVADRQSRELLIKPSDQYRYGYRLWVDTETALLLKSELVNADGEVLETFTFSEVETGVYIGDALLAAQTQGKEMVTQRSEPGKKPDTIPEDSQASQWRADWLPAGFTLVALQNRLRANNGAYVEQRVYSDGLSSVSVFIETSSVNPHHLKGGSSVGAVNAFGTVKHSHLVTVVGEVPAQTVQKIGEAIRFSTRLSP